MSLFRFHSVRSTSTTNHRVSRQCRPTLDGLETRQMLTADTAKILVPASISTLIQSKVEVVASKSFLSGVRSEVQSAQGSTTKGVLDPTKPNLVKTGANSSGDQLLAKIDQNLDALQKASDLSKTKSSLANLKESRLAQEAALVDLKRDLATLQGTALTGDKLWDSAIKAKVQVYAEVRTGLNLDAVMGAATELKKALKGGISSVDALNKFLDADEATSKKEAKKTAFSSVGTDPRLDAIKTQREALLVEETRGVDLGSKLKG